MTMDFFRSVEPPGGDERLGAGEPVHKTIPGGLPGENLDFHAQVVERHLGIEDPGDADGILLGRDDGVDPAAAAAADEILDFAGGIAVVVGVGF